MVNSHCENIFTQIETKALNGGAKSAHERRRIVLGKEIGGALVVLLQRNHLTQLLSEI